MAMTDGERRAYSRGYNRSCKDWPAHLPPYPPCEIVAQLMKAARDLRFEIDTLLATTMDEELEAQLGPKLDAIDEANEAITEWMKLICD